MTLAGGCANKNLVRLGGGSVRSLVVLVFMGIASYMTLKGLFGQWRASLLDPVNVEPGRARLVRPGPGHGAGPGHRHGRQGGAAGDGGRCACWPAGLRLQGQALPRQRHADRRRAWCSARSSWRAGTSPATWATARTPTRWRRSIFATNTRTLESLSFVAPLAYSLELLMLWTDKLAARHLRHRQRAGRDRRLGGLRAGHAHASAGRASPRWTTCATSSSAPC